jgi:hypothetical protein
VKDESFTTLQGVLSLTQAWHPEIVGNRHGLRRYMASGHFLCVGHGRSIESLLNLAYQGVSAGRVYYYRAKTDAYILQRSI